MIQVQYSLTWAGSDILDICTIIWTISVSYGPMFVYFSTGLGGGNAHVKKFKSEGGVINGCLAEQNPNIVRAMDLMRMTTPSSVEGERGFSQNRLLELSV